MALETSFQIVESPESDAIWIFDTTGFYHVTNNPTGWGGVNPSTTDHTMEDPYQINLLIRLF